MCSERLAFTITLAITLVVNAMPLRSATIEGTVSLTAAPQREKPVAYNRGVYRSSAKRPTPRSPSPVDVVVYLENPPASSSSPPAAGPFVMRQNHDRFVPHVLPITAGSKVEFPNEDDYYHNVFSIVSGDRFDLGRFAGGEKASVRFDEEAIVVVRCEIHSRMKAYIVVLDHPFFTAPESSGAFRLEKIPPGSYTVKAWHPTAGEKQTVITVPSHTSVVNLSLDF
jgi:plastocyanin